MIKKIIIFSSLFVLLISTSFSAGSTFLSIIYGYNPLSLNDFNDHAESLGSIFSYLYNELSPPGTPEKSVEFEKLSHANSFESEMRIEFAPRFEIGLVFTYFATQKISENTITAGEYSIAGRMDTKITLLNPNLVLYHYIPLSKAFYVELYAGGGYYYAQVPFKQDLNYDLPEFSSQQKVDTNLRSHGWGALAGITFEIRPLKFVGLLFGARYRYVEMGKIFGSGTIEDSEEGVTDIDNGNLYYYINKEMPEIGDLPSLIFAEEEPQNLAEVRQAKLDLSGYTLLVGLRFWF